MIHRTSLWALLIGTFLFGFLIGQMPMFETTKQLNTGDVLNACVTIFMGFALSVVFQRNFSEARVEKDLLMGLIRDVGAAMQSTRALFVKSYIDGSSDQRDREIVTSLRNLSNYLYTLETAAVTCRPGYVTESLKRAREDFRRARRALADRAFATGTTYSEEVYARVEGAFSALHRDMFMFSIEINKR